MKKIGEGFTASIYTDGYFAYKKYHKQFPMENLLYETKVQNEIYKMTKLNILKYELDGTLIKMTLLTGDSLAKKLVQDQDESAFEDFIKLKIDIFTYKDLNLGDAFEIFVGQIKETSALENLKEKAINSINKIQRLYRLCHFDFHPENVVYHEEEPYIIDWMNAKLGNPVMDIASTYIIFCLYAKEYAKKYMASMVNYGYKESEIKDAIPAMAFIRYRETEDDKLRKMLEDLILGGD